jgi:hypothetical protein
MQALLIGGEVPLPGSGGMFEAYATKLHLASQRV